MPHLDHQPVLDSRNETHCPGYHEHNLQAHFPDNVASTAVVRLAGVLELFKANPNILSVAAQSARNAPHPNLWSTFRATTEVRVKGIPGTLCPLEILFPLRTLQVDY